MFGSYNLYLAVFKYMFVIRHYKFFPILSGVVMAAAFGALVIWGLALSIDFNGGSLIEVRYPSTDSISDTASEESAGVLSPSGRPDFEEVRASVDALSLGGYTLQPTGEDGYLLRTRTLSEEEHRAVLDALSPDDNREIIEERFASVGPAIGAELQRKAIIALALVLVAIILLIAFTFRKVSEPISSWLYGVVAIITLLHDVIVPAGVFAILGAFAGIEVDALFVSALLAILGYSVNDTIVVFDRVRERLASNRTASRREPFEVVVGESLRETYGRSINTSLTVGFVLVALYVFGPETIRYFSLALLIGAIAGSYSSIFFASPLLVGIYNFRTRQK